MSLDHDPEHAIWLSTDGRAYCENCEREIQLAPGELGRIMTRAFLKARSFVDEHTVQIKVRNP